MGVSVLSLEVGCPLLLALGERYEDQAGFKFQQVVLVMFGFGLSGDPTKQSEGNGEVAKCHWKYAHCHSRSVSLERWWHLINPATLNLQQCLCTQSCSSGLGWNRALLAHKGFLGKTSEGRKPFLHNGTQILQSPTRSLLRPSLMACGSWQPRWDGMGQSLKMMAPAGDVPYSATETGCPFVPAFLGMFLYVQLGKMTCCRVSEERSS